MITISLYRILFLALACPVIALCLSAGVATLAEGVMFGPDLPGRPAIIIQGAGFMAVIMVSIFGAAGLAALLALYWDRVASFNPTITIGKRNAIAEAKVHKP